MTAIVTCGFGVTPPCGMCTTLLALVAVCGISVAAIMSWSWLVIRFIIRLIIRSWNWHWHRHRMRMRAPWMRMKVRMRAPWMRMKVRMRANVRMKVGRANVGMEVRMRANVRMKVGRANVGRADVGMRAHVGRANVGMRAHVGMEEECHC